MLSPNSSYYSEARQEPGIRIKSQRLALMSSVACPGCAGYNTTRAHRRSFFQKVILFHLGYYPWKCIDCASRFFSKERGHHEVRNLH